MDPRRRCWEPSPPPRATRGRGERIILMYIYSLAVAPFSLLWPHVNIYSFLFRERRDRSYYQFCH
jgi:hypothetical protein